MYLKKAIDINTMPFVDEFKGMTHGQAFQQIQKFRHTQETFVKSIEALLPSENPSMQDKMIVSMLGVMMNSQDAVEFNNSLFKAIKLTMAKVQLPPAELEKFAKVYIHLTKADNIPERIVAALTKSTKIATIGKTIEGYWKKYPEKTDHLVVGNMRVNFGAVNMSQDEIDMVKEAFDIIHRTTSSSKIPHFKDAFYGEYTFIEAGSLGRASAVYHNSSDNIFIDGSVLKRGVDLIAHSCIHETCHRYYAKVLNDSEKADWGTFYTTTANTPIERALPQIGDSLYWKYGLIIGDNNGVPITVPGKDSITKIVGHGNRALYIVKSNKGQELMVTWSELNSLGLFPTMYARQDAEEFFCEVVSHFTVGKLPSPLKEWFEEEINNKFITPYAVEKHTLIPKDKIDMEELYEDEVTELQEMCVDFSVKFKSVSPQALSAVKAIKEVLNKNYHNKYPWLIEKHKVDDLYEEHHKHKLVYDAEMAEREKVVTEGFNRKERELEEQRNRPKQQEASPDIRMMISYILAHGSASETKYANSVASYLNATGSYSDKQFKAIQDIYNRITKRGVTPQVQSEHNLERLDNLLEKANAKNNAFAVKFTTDMIKMLSSRGRLTLSEKQEQVLKQLYRQFGV